MTTDFKNTKVVFLDVDNTLLDFQAAQREALVGMLAYFHEPCDRDRENRFDVLNKDYWKKLERGEIALDVMVVERFAKFFEREKIVGDPVVAEKVYREHLGNNHDVIPGAMDVLRYLKGKYAVYLVTNGREGSQTKRLTDSGILSMVDGAFISETVGYRKPQKEFFSYVFSHIPPVKKEETVIIGDSYTGDVAGGKNYGIPTIWYNWKNREGTADVIIKDLKKLYELL